MSSFKRSQVKHVKKRYQAQNWAEYEQGLRNRGSLTVWVGMVDGKLDYCDGPKALSFFAHVLRDATLIVVPFFKLLRNTPTGFIQN